MAVDKWNDDRLDELNRRLVNVESVHTSVAVIKSEQHSMKVTLSRVEDGVAAVSKKLGEVVDEPLVRARDFRRQVFQGVLAAMAGGAFVFLATLLAGAVH